MSLREALRSLAVSLGEIAAAADKMGSPAGGAEGDPTPIPGRGYIPIRRGSDRESVMPDRTREAGGDASGGGGNSAYDPNDADLGPIVADPDWLGAHCRRVGIPGAGTGYDWRAWEWDCGKFGRYDQAGNRRTKPAGRSSESTGGQHGPARGREMVDLDSVGPDGGVTFGGQWVPRGSSGGKSAAEQEQITALREIAQEVRGLRQDSRITLGALETRVRADGGV